MKENFIIAIDKEDLVSKQEVPLTDNLVLIDPAGDAYAAAQDRTLLKGSSDDMKDEVNKRMEERKGKQYLLKLKYIIIYVGGQYFLLFLF